MIIHDAVLPEGWYPRDVREIRDLIKKYSSAESLSGSVTGGVVPHAGWFFCAELMIPVLSALPEDTETVVVAGGHLPAGASPLIYQEDGYHTPAGDYLMDGELRDLLMEEGGFVADRQADNTVEVILPLLKVLLPDSRLVGMRLPPDQTALDIGHLINDKAKVLGRKTVVIGSTDLTHYGANYGFMPPESLDDPVGWVKKRDEKVIRRLADLDGKGALIAAEADQSACSVGGAVAAASFASGRGKVSSSIVGYATSLDKYRGGGGDSFVGYCGILFFNE